MTDRELMQQALQALEFLSCGDEIDEALIVALRQRLEQPEQEPVAWVTGWHDGHCVIRAVDLAVILPIGTAFYTTPQPETVIDKSAAIRIATALGWEPRKPEQEPVAWANKDDLQNFDMRVRTNCDLMHTVPLYTAPPPQRTWVGLTDEEMVDLQDRCGISIHQSDFEAIEAKLREKNT